jgi:hypothetical protein
LDDLTSVIWISKWGVRLLFFFVLRENYISYYERSVWLCLIF